MRKTAGLAGAVLVLALITPALPAASAAITGTACKTVATKKIASGLLYQCQKVKIAKKWQLRWGKGTLCRNAAQRLTISGVLYGCQKVGTRWLWYKKPLPIVYPNLTLQKDFTILQGGDVDVLPYTVPQTAISGWLTGNGRPAAGRDNTPDSFMNVAVIDGRAKGVPSPFHTVVSISYYDSGTDSFSIQYDSKNGPWATSRVITKTNTTTVKTAVFNICDGGFQHRNNGGDIRIDDRRDGAELITDVSMKYLPSGVQTWNVDDFGANPFDSNPDSDAIQAVLNQTCSGDTVTFTSGTEGVNGFNGYLIDKTIKLIGNTAKDHMKFTSTNAMQHSLFKATPSLLGFVARIFAQGSMDMANIGKVDDITLERIDIDSNRQQRRCTGPDGQADGHNDNWGSSDPGDLLEIGNPGTNPGGLLMDGAADTADPNQDYIGHPDRWSTNVVIQDLTIKNVECGTSLGMIYSAKATIQRVTVLNAGEHHHTNPTCDIVDNDGDTWSWADGMTIGGPDMTVQDNHVVNPSDVGIVTFGGKGQKILNNLIETTSGNVGTFAGIHVQVGAYGNLSDLQIVGNTLRNTSNSACGGMHIGVALSSLTFLAGCTFSYFGTQYGSQWGPTYGTNGGCNYEDLVTKPVVGRCAPMTFCTAWVHADPGHPIILRNNSVTGAQVNYTVGLVDGVIIDENNTSTAPQDTDWETAANCRGTVINPTDKMAQLPSLPGWTDFGLTCWG